MKILPGKSNPNLKIVQFGNRFVDFQMNNVVTDSLPFSPFLTAYVVNFGKSRKMQDKKHEKPNSLEKRAKEKALDTKDFRSYYFDKESQKTYLLISLIRAAFPCNARK